MARSAAMPSVPLPTSVLATPLIRRVVWHIRRGPASSTGASSCRSLEGILIMVAIAAVLITLLEKPLTFGSLFDSFNWGIATVLGQGDAGYVTSPGGRAVGWLLILFGVGMLALITGALVALVVDFLLKEGQGLGASGHREHIVVCGWNSTARDLLDELKGDDYKQKVVVLAIADKNPAGAGVYFVRGDATDADDLERAGIEFASAAIVFPSDASDEADMHSILSIMAIKSVAPQVRTVAEVNNPRHEPHFQRAEVDELLVTSKMASHLLARSALYPGLSVAGDRHRVGRRGFRAVPGQAARGVSRASRSTRSRRGCATITGRRCCRSIAAGAPTSTRPRTSCSSPGDDAVVVAETLGDLAPLEMQDLYSIPRTAAAVPSA